MCGAFFVGSHISTRLAVIKLCAKNLPGGDDLGKDIGKHGQFVRMKVIPPTVSKSGF